MLLKNKYIRLTYKNNNMIENFKKWLLEKRIKSVPLASIIKAITKFILNNITEYLKNSESEISTEEYWEYLLKTNQVYLSLYPQFFELKINTNGKNKTKLFNIIFPKNKMEEFEKMCYNRGYFLAGLNPDGLRIQAQVNEQLMINPPKYLYHITSLKNKDKILKKGLVPSEGKRDLYQYPPRVYLILN